MNQNTQCDCDQDATMHDDAGFAVCDECATYTTLGDGTCVCSRQTDGLTRCHECKGVIHWGPILTGPPGASAYSYGDCACGRRAWRTEEDGGNWDRYSYEPEEQEEGINND